MSEGAAAGASVRGADGGAGLGRGRSAALLIAVAGGAVAVVLWLRGMDRHGDEGHHLRQIQAFCRGEARLDPKLTVPPGYHLASAALGRWIGDCSLPAMRRVNVGFGLLSVAAFLYACLALPAARPALRTLQYAALPVLVPYHFLVYTDPLALALLLLAIGLQLRSRERAAALAATASLLVRQTHVAWLVFLVLYLWFERPEASLRAFARRAWPACAGLAAFAVFVAVNGGVALGDARAHRAGLHIGNLCLLLLLVPLLFLPHVAALLWRRRRELLRPLPLAAAAAAAAACWLGLRVEHAYNRFPGFLRNELLMAMEAVGPRAAAAAAAAVGGAALSLERLPRPALLALVPASLLALAPAKLIEHRYALPVLVLFLLFRRDDPPAVEAASLGWSLLLSAAVLAGLSRGAFAL